MTLHKVLLNCLAKISHQAQLLFIYLIHRFITGIPLKPEDTKPSRIPRVFIDTGSGPLQEFQLLVYRALNVTVCALVNGKLSTYYHSDITWNRPGRIVTMLFCITLCMC